MDGGLGCINDGNRCQADIGASPGYPPPLMNAQPTISQTVIASYFVKYCPFAEESQSSFATHLKSVPVRAPVPVTSGPIWGTNEK